MDDQFKKDILKRFDTVIKLLTISTMKESTQTQKIKFLSDAGLSPKEIADMLGTTSNTVSVALHNMKNKGKPEDKKSEQLDQTSQPSAQTEGVTKDV